MTAPQERSVPPEVTVDEGGRQILAPGFRRYLPEAAERLPMSEAERALRIEVLWGRVEHLEGLLGSIIGSMEGLLGDRPKRNTDDSLSFHPHWLNR